jgi:hypothetical protein
MHSFQSENKALSTKQRKYITNEQWFLELGSCWDAELSISTLV